MDNKLAQKIIQHFTFDVIQTLDAYVEDRKEYLHRQMETVNDSDSWRKYQGACAELEWLKKIRDYAIAIKDKGNG